MTWAPDKFLTEGYGENLGECNGAICGVWGDPHILSCDGLGYDCQAVGLFTLMKNFLYNIQGRFVHISSVEMDLIFQNDSFSRATYMTDFVIQNVKNTDVPVMQFSFPEFAL